MPKDHFRDAKLGKVVRRAHELERNIRHPHNFLVTEGMPHPGARERDMVDRFQGTGAGHAVSISDTMTGEFYCHPTSTPIHDLFVPVFPELAEALRTKGKHPQVKYGKELVTITLPAEAFLKLAAHYDYPYVERKLDMKHPPFAEKWAELNAGKQPSHAK